MVNWIDTLLQGVLVGGLYALFAMGQSLMFGVMRLTNTAHGDLTVLASFAAFGLLSLAGGHATPLPWLILALLPPLAFGAGYGLQRLVLNGTVGKDPLPSLVVTFGISIVIQNLLMEVFSSDPRAIDTGNSVARPITTPRGPSVKRIPGTSSRGTAAATYGRSL